MALLLVIDCQPQLSVLAVPVKDTSNPSHGLAPLEQFRSKTRTMRLRGLPNTGSKSFAEKRRLFEAAITTGWPADGKTDLRIKTLRKQDGV